MLSVNKLMSSLALPSSLVASSGTDRNSAAVQDITETSKQDQRKDITHLQLKKQKEAEDGFVVPSSTNLDDAVGQQEKISERVKERRGSASTSIRLSNTNSKSRTLHHQEAVDPLTFQILKRTGTESAIQQKTTRELHDEVEGDVAPRIVGPAQDHGLDLQSWRAGNDGIVFTGPFREKRKGVSFLSKLMGNKRRDSSNEAFDGDKRIEGNNASVFSQPIGYVPTLPPPPKYIKVRSVNKTNREFNHVFLAQELYKEPFYEDSSTGDSAATPNNQSQTSLASAIPRHKSGAIWTMQFSKDGKCLATGGQDKTVRIWAVISSEADRIAHEKEEEQASSQSSDRDHIKLNAPVFRTEPIQEYTGHNADVLDLSWSKNNFLLSSSMDKTVRLWHVSRGECLCIFQHSDFVTSIAFHPRDDRFFLAGSLDHKIRLWSIPDNAVAFQTEVPDIITAVNFSPDGRLSIAGSLGGICHIFETEKLLPAGQIHVRSTHGKNSKGSKITGIDTMEIPSEKGDGMEIKLLVTSNDSRVRMYNLADKTLDVKLKGYENACSQIRASFSDDARYIICGSEDKRIYIWDRLPLNEKDRDKRPYEYFEAHSTIVTNAILAPAKTRELLGRSGDPMYELCDPPPVTLVSLAELENGRQVQRDESEEHSQRSSHPRGNIIVSSDYTGRIKVFRQDCAAAHRAERSETASVLSRHLTGVSRRSSIRSWKRSVGGHFSFEQSQSSLKEES